MATFITTIKFTLKGLAAIGETTKRATALAASAAKVNARVKDVYWTLGDHDGLLIFEAPDDETAAAFLLAVGSQGNVHTTTCRAFTTTEMDTILSQMRSA
jgi:uncharacterized protein with GYD domain